MADDQLDGEDQDQRDGEGSPSREAQRLRADRRALQSERDALLTERDGLAARVQAMQRRQVEQVASAVLADGADVWLDGTDLDALLVEGEVDENAVADAARALVERRGRRFARPSGAFDGGADRGARPSPPPASWSTVLTPDYRDRVEQGRQ